MLRKMFELLKKSLWTRKLKTTAIFEINQSLLKRKLFKRA